MANFVRNNALYSVDPPILAYGEGNKATRHVVFQKAYVTAGSDNIVAAPAGLFGASVNGVIRFLPRGTVTVASTTGAATISLTPQQVFVPGDVLYVVEPYTILTLSAVATGNTITLTYNGLTLSLTLTAGQATTLATAASAFASAINTAGGVFAELSAVSDGVSAIWIFARNGISNYTVAKGGTATSALSSTSIVPNTTPVGTIASINVVTGVFTLTGNAGVAVPVGVHVGVSSSITTILGLGTSSMNFTIYPNVTQALYTESAAVRSQYLPYFDGNIQYLFKGRLSFGVQF
jgi:hypothetical protein